jgi:hypothetical protein
MHGVKFAELADHAWIDIAPDPIWCDFWRVSERRSAPPRFGASGRTLDDLLEPLARAERSA